MTGSGRSAYQPDRPLRLVRSTPAPALAARLEDTAPPGSVAVCVDFSTDSTLGLAWALAHAARMHQPVHLVHVQPDPAAGPAAQAAGLELLAAGLAEADQVPGVRASASALPYDPLGVAHRLLTATRPAAAVVVGARGHGVVTGLLLGAVSRRVAREAGQPVVVVRATADPQAETVVVGVDDSAAAGSALEVALAWAARHGHSLRVLRAWPAGTTPTPAVPRPVSTGLGEAMRREQDDLTRRLPLLCRAEPTVQVTGEVVPGPAGTALVDASAHAALVVVGARGRTAGGVPRLGSVAQTVLSRARCPVAVVH